MKILSISMLCICMTQSVTAFVADVTSSSPSWFETVDGDQIVQSGGTASSARIEMGGHQTVNSGGTAWGATIDNGGKQTVLNGGNVRGLIIINSGGTQDIANGTAMGNSAGTEIILRGGTQIIRGGSVTGLINMTSGTQYIMGNATFHSGMTVQNGDQIISDTASVAGVTVGSGGCQIINDSANVSGTEVMNGGRQIFKSANATLSGSHYIRTGGELIFEANANIVSGGFITLAGGKLSLDGTHNNMNFININVSGGVFGHRSDGIIGVRLNPGNGGLDSDFYTFKAIEGRFNIKLSYASDDISAFNTLGNIPIIKIEDYGSSWSHAFDVFFSDDIDIGLYNWKMLTDSNGLTSVINTWEPSTMVMNTTNHAHSVQTTVRSLSNSMHKRVGELQWLEQTSTASSGERTTNAVWMRGLFTHQSANNSNATGNMVGAEAGYDVKLLNTNRNKIYLGLMGHAASNIFEFKSANSNKDTGDVTSYGTGLYAIWLGSDGWFADAAVRQHFISQDATMHAMGISGTTTFDTSHTATSVNIDIGKQFVFNMGNKDTWFLTPHLQFNAAQISGSDFTMSNGMTGQIEDMMNANIGLMLMGGPRWKMRDGSDMQLYAKGGYIADFSDDPSTMVSGMNLQREFGVGNIEIGGGLNYRSADKRITTHIDIQQRFGDGFIELSGIVGLRYGF